MDFMAGEAYIFGETSQGKIVLLGKGDNNQLGDQIGSTWTDKRMQNKHGKVSADAMHNDNLSVSFSDVNIDKGSQN